MKCPKCGALLQENARFCFYCMESFTEKETVEISKNSKRNRWFLWCSLLTALICLVAVGVFTFVHKNSKNNKSESVIISNFEDYKLRAVYLTGKEGLSSLWNPDGLLLTHMGKDREGDTWEVYATDVYIDQANMQIYFCEGGIEVVSAVTGLTEQTRDDGLQLLECSVASVLNYTLDNFGDILSDPDLYPMSQVDGNKTMLEMAGLPDSAGEKVDENSKVSVMQKTVKVDFTERENEYLVVQVRSRIYDGKQYYDYFVLHTIDE